MHDHAARQALERYFVEFTLAVVSIREPHVVGRELDPHEHALRVLHQALLPIYHVREDILRADHEAKPVRCFSAHFCMKDRRSA